MEHTATYSPEDNKLRLYPATRLDPETYAKVKEAGFIWAPKQELFVAPAWSPAREDLLIELCGEIDDEDKSLVDRAEERAERFEDYGEKRAEDASRAQKAVSAIADNIPLGQPILVGHHSEKHARKDAERIRNGMTKAVKMWEQSKYWESRAKGAIRSAKYKERPDVRARRIKGLEADLRKQNKLKAETELFLKLWSRIDDPNLIKRDDGQPMTATDRAEWIAGRDHLSFHFPLSQYPREAPISQYEGSMSLWSALDEGIIDGQKAATLAVSTHEKYIPYCERWINHYTNRLAYERAMLEESGGTIADRTKPERGGACKCWVGGGKWIEIQKVNRISVTVLDNWGNGGRDFTRTIPFDKLKGVMSKADWEACGKDPLHEPDPEKALRALWDKQGVPKEKQDALVKEVEEKAKPGAKVGPFTIGQEPVTTNLKLSLDTEVIDVLKKAIFTEDSIELPPALEKSLYEKVNKAIEKVGGHWEKKRKAHVFGQDPAALFDIDKGELKGEEINIEGMKAALKAGVKVVSAPQLFPTPPEIAERMATLAGIEPDSLVLEPSAGTGNLLKAILQNENVRRVVAIEMNYNLAEILAQQFGQDSRVTLIRGDFLDHTKESIDFKHPEAVRGFDRIIMNPPFEKGQDVKHIKHALTTLKPGGRLVALCANGPRQREALKDIADYWEDLPAGSFKEAGTGVNVALLIINKGKESLTMDGGGIGRQDPKRSTKPRQTDTLRPQAKEPETLYLSGEFKKREFPPTKKEVEINFKDTPLFKAQVKAEIAAHQLTLFEEKGA